MVLGSETVDDILCPKKASIVTEQMVDWLPQYTYFAVTTFLCVGLVVAVRHNGCLNCDWPSCSLSFSPFPMRQLFGFSLVRKIEIPGEGSHSPPEHGEHVFCMVPAWPSETRRGYVFTWAVKEARA